jgi:hypothetical protein
MLNLSSSFSLVVAKTSKLEAGPKGAEPLWPRAEPAERAAARRRRLETGFIGTEGQVSVRDMVRCPNLERAVELRHKEVPLLVTSHFL